MIESLTATSEESTEVGRDHLYLLRMKNQVSFGLDLKDGEVSVKCYLYPALKSYLTGKSFRALVNHAVDSIGGVCYPALDTVHEYLESAGLYNQYSFIGIDCTAVSKSRLKVYNTIQDVTWSKLQDIWTLGGRFKSHATIQRGLQFAQKFWQLVTLDQVSDYECPFESYQAILTYYPVSGENGRRHLELRTRDWIQQFP
jgi:DMATS type aromatic prenyltransferase